MKKLATTLFALFLALAVLVPTLVACGGDSTTSSSTTNSVTDGAGTGTSSVTTGVTETTEPEFVDDEHDLPEDLYYEGSEFVLGTYTGGNTGWSWAFYLDVDEPEAGNLLQEAVYTRNAQIFEELGVDIKCQEDWVWDGSGAGLTMAMDVCARAGVEVYHGMFIESPCTLEGLIIDELIYDIATLPYVDLTKSYYNQRINDAFYLRDNLYIVFGDFSTSVQNAAHWLVNNDMLIDIGYQPEYLYDKVDNYDWTMADVMELIDGLYSDVNSDGAKDLGDIYGIAGACGSINPLYVASGLVGAYLTDDGFAFDYGTDKSYEVFNMIYELADHADVYIDAGYPAYADTPWFNGRSLFHCNASELYHHKDLPFEFGVLPLPMYNDEQDSYYCYGSGGHLIVPGNILDEEFVGATIEAFTAYSASTVKVAFYDYYMEQGVLRDQASRNNWKRMLSDWNVRELVSVICPDGRLVFLDVVYQLLRDRDPGYQAKWDSQKESIEETCWIFYEFYLFAE